MSYENDLCCCNHHLRHIDKTVHCDGYCGYHVVLLSPCADPEGGGGGDRGSGPNLKITKILGFLAILVWNP